MRISSETLLAMMGGMGASEAPTSSGDGDASSGFASLLKDALLGVQAGAEAATPAPPDENLAMGAAEGLAVAEGEPEGDPAPEPAQPDGWMLDAPDEEALETTCADASSECALTTSTDAVEDVEAAETEAVDPAVSATAAASQAVFVPEVAMTSDGGETGATEQEAVDSGEAPKGATVAVPRATVETNAAAPAGHTLDDAQPSEAQPSEAQPSEAQPSEAQPSEAQPSEAQPHASNPAEPNHAATPVAAHAAPVADEAPPVATPVAAHAAPVADEAPPAATPTQALADAQPPVAQAETASPPNSMPVVEERPPEPRQAAATTPTDSVVSPPALRSDATAAASRPSQATEPGSTPADVPERLASTPQSSVPPEEAQVSARRPHAPVQVREEAEPARDVHVAAAQPLTRAASPVDTSSSDDPAALGKEADGRATASKQQASASSDAAATGGDTDADASSDEDAFMPAEPDDSSTLREPDETTTSFDPIAPPPSRASAEPPQPALEFATATPPMTHGEPEGELVESSPSASTDLPTTEASESIEEALKLEVPDLGDVEVRVQTHEDGSYELVIVASERSRFSLEQHRDRLLEIAQQELPPDAELSLDLQTREESSRDPRRGEQERASSVLLTSRARMRSSAQRSEHPRGLIDEVA